MNEAEVKEAILVEETHDYVRLPPPPAAAPARQVAPASRIDAVLTLIERRPVAAAAAIFLALAATHLVLLNIAGVASFIFIGDEIFLATGSNAVGIVMLAFVAYSIVLPTLLGRACVSAYDDIRPALALDDTSFAKSRTALNDPFSFWRLCFGLFWAVILTPVFGDLFRAAVPGEAGGAALLTIWLYIRIALIFGLTGANITFVAMLHYRFQASTSTQLRVDLFDPAPLQPVSRYARNVALLLVVPLALAGPAIAQPEAMIASSLVLALGIALTGVAVAGAMWGTRRAIRAAKKIALQELQSYSRELWRRAYSDGRLTEAVAIPALGAMLTVRAEIARLSDWPGGWSVFARVAALTAIPALSWFGGQLASEIMQSLIP